MGTGNQPFTARGDLSLPVMADDQEIDLISCFQQVLVISSSDKPLQPLYRQNLRSGGKRKSELWLLIVAQRCQEPCSPDEALGWTHTEACVPIPPNNP